MGKRDRIKLMEKHKIRRIEKKIIMSKVEQCCIFNKLVES